MATNLHADRVEVFAFASTGIRQALLEAAQVIAERGPFDETAIRYEFRDDTHVIVLPKLNRKARCPHTRWDGMVGVGRSYQCTDEFDSEEALYRHLRDVERYPREDAGSSAARAWRER